MFENSRRDFLLGLMVPLTIGACAAKSESQDVARKFIDAYYVRINLADARTFAVDLASEKIQHQIELTSGLPPPASANAPQVEYRLVSEEPSPGSAAYVFEVKPQVSDVGARKVFVKLREEGGQWKVTQFSEAAPTL